MLVFVGFSLLVIALINSLVLRDSALGSTSVHSICIASCPISDHAELYRAIVCGSSISNADIRSDFVQTGLIHLLIVSGQHFQFLEWLVETATSRLPSVFKWAIGVVVMLGFTLASGGCAPGVRAAASWSSRRLSDQFKLGWSPVQVAIISTAVALSLCRTTNDVASLALSATAAATLTLSRRKMNQRKSVRSLVAIAWERFKAAIVIQSRLYLVLLPALCSIAVPHPLSIAWNLLAGSLIGHFLFPVSLMGFFVPGFVRLSDFAWGRTISLVHWFGTMTPRFLASVPLPSFFPVAYSLVVLTFAFLMERRRRLAALSILVLSFQVRASELVVWNVGQGSWATIVDSETCDHFDMGGEFAPWMKIRATCEGRRNSVRFSHWDWDHVSFSREARRSLDPCLSARPGGVAPNGREDLLKSMATCASTDLEVREHTPYRWLQSKRRKSSNDSSRVFSVNGALFTGDATRDEEKALVGLSRGRILILPHHGSKTSTSSRLLDRVQPKMAIASARKKKYGHPHAVVADRLKARGVALLRTEEWGSIRIQMKRPKLFELRPLSTSKIRRITACTVDTPC